MPGRAVDGEGVEALGQPTVELGELDVASARRGQLDRQRNAVEALADRGDQVRVEGGGARRGPRPVDEQLDGAGRRTIRRQRRQLEHVLAR